MVSDTTNVCSLVINPGSTSTKVAVYKGNALVISENVNHPREEIVKYGEVLEQKTYRTDAVMSVLNSKGFDLTTLSCVIGRGGALKPMKGGVYLVNEAMLKDLKERPIYQHVSNLGAFMAYEIAKTLSINAYIADPICVDEFSDFARISGLPQVPRISMLHALSIRATAHKASDELSIPFNSMNAIVAHLGGGFSICAIENGKMVDTNNANEEGPFSPERSGSLPMGDLLELCMSGKYTKEEMKNKVLRNAGFAGYLGISDGREVEMMIQKGDSKALMVAEAMFYQISKEIGAMATVLSGKVDAILLTGGLANWKRLVDYVSEKTSYIAKVLIYPGENEMEALNEAIQRVTSGKEETLTYM